MGQSGWLVVRIFSPFRPKRLFRPDAAIPPTYWASGTLRSVPQVATELGTRCVPDNSLLQQVRYPSRWNDPNEIHLFLDNDSLARSQCDCTPLLRIGSKND